MKRQETLQIVLIPNIFVNINLSTYNVIILNLSEKKIINTKLELFKKYFNVFGYWYPL